MKVFYWLTTIKDKNHTKTIGWKISESDLSEYGLACGQVNYTALYMKPQRNENYLKFDIEFDNSVLKRVYMPSSLKSAVDFCHFWQNYEAQNIHVDNGSHTHTHTHPQKLW